MPGALAAARSARAQWILSFSGTLLELWPMGDEHETQRIASDLWDDLGHFDPILAAEMHHESEFTDA